VILDDRFWPSVQALADCLCTALAEHDAGPLCYCGVSVDRPVEQVGNGKGTAWATLINVQPNSDDTQGTLGPCMPPLVGTVEVGVLRCYPTPTPPKYVTVEQNRQAIEALLSDQRAMLAAVCCAQEEIGFISSIQSWEQIGPEGGIIGGVLTILISEP
jgi:hypothetical protein